ncbi:MAG: DUF4142 domain-containing protein [Asticcacaulis sp.]
MKTKLIYQITGVIAAVSAACALSAAAQDMPPKSTPPVVPPVSAQAQPTPDGDATAANPAGTTDQTAPLPGTAASTAMPQAAAGATTDVSSALAPKDFMQQAYRANEFGIAASQLALTRAESPDAKAAAQTILNDGMKVRQDMVAAIQGSSSDMHFDQGWDDHYKGLMADLQNASGASFDQTYLATQSEVTSTATGLFQSYADAGSDTAVKTFARNTLPVLQLEATKLDAASSTSAGAAGK